jgi:DNA-binding NarL/FixJ family response regulator
METIQVAITDAPFAAALRELLVRNGSWEVLCVDRPDPERDGVMVLDSEHLSLLSQPIPNPERVVMVARNDSDDMARAWEAGVTSVITDKDPLNTAVLAIMAARLRIAKSSQSGSMKEAPGAKPPAAATIPDGVTGKARSRGR